MTDAATAQPEAIAPGGQGAPVAETTAAPPETTAQPAQPSEPEKLSDEAALSKLYDEIQARDTAKPWDKPKSDPAAAKPPAIPAADQAGGDGTAKADAGQASPPTATDAIAAPATWHAEYSAKWAAVPPEVQKYIVNRENAITQYVKQNEPLKQYFDQFRTYVPQGQEAQVVGQLLAAQAYLDQKPLDGIKELVEFYKLDKAQLAQALGLAPAAPAQSNGQQPTAESQLDDLFKDPRLDRQVMPEVQAMKAELERVKQTLTQREYVERQAQIAAQQQRVSEAESAIAKFSHGKADWAEVAADVVHEVAKLRQSNPSLSHEEMLKQAYDRARWANPITRQRIIADEKKQSEEKARKEAAAQAAQAKKLASMNVRSGASATTPTFDGKWDDKDRLGALYDRIQAGA